MAAQQAPQPTQRSPAGRALRALLWTLLVLVLLAVLATGGLWWWAGTDGSLATALRYAARSQPLQADRPTGSLRAGGHVDRLLWQKDGLTVDARDVTLAWQAWALLHGTLQLDRIAAASMQVNDARTPSTTPSTPPTAIGLPLPVTLDAFSVGQLRWNGASSVLLNGIAGRYHFTGSQHELDLTGLDFASGRYTARAVLASRGAMTLDATVTGALTAAVPGSATPLGLSFTATAKGLLTDLQVKADLLADAQSAAASLKPQASATARVMPWAAQPLPEADARFTDLDLAALWPDAPRSRLTGSASVRPADASVALARAAWLLQLDVANQSPGPWDQGLLPIERVQTQAEWRGAAAAETNAAAPAATSGLATIRSFKALLGGGEINASGQWASAPAAPVAATAAAPTAPAASAPAVAAPAPAEAWQVEATLQHIDPARLHTQLAPLPIDGKATVRSAGGLDAVTAFDVALQAAGAQRSALASEVPAPRKARAQAGALGQLRLRDASATGSWNPHTAGGATLLLSALQLRTDDAELKGQLEAQPAAQGGKGRLTLTAPGLDAVVDGELRPTRGAGELSLRGRDAAQALRWLQKLPGLQDARSAIQTASVSGNGQLNATWRGGWQDPALQAKLEVPTLDLRLAAPAAPARAPRARTLPSSTPSGTPAGPAPDATAQAAAPTVIQVRALQADLGGKLSQAQLGVQGRVEMGERRYSLQLAAEGGRGNSTAPLASSPWQGLVKQLALAVEDPALGGGAWRLATRGNVALKWTPTANGGAFESGAGEAVLTAPAARSASGTAVALGSGAANTMPSQAVVNWQPVRCRSGELTTAGKLSGLPLAWVELFAGPQLAGAGLTGNLLFDGEWDARLADTLQLKASLARRSGDITVQADASQGGSARIAAGIKAARIAVASQGDAITLSLLWDSERAGTASGQLATRLTRAPEGQGVGGWLWPDSAPLTGQLKAQLPRIGVWSVLAPPGWRLRGSLGADIAVSGTRSAPQLAGDLLANDLALRSVVDGIEFGSGRLRARLDGTRMRIEEFTLQGAGDKGTGGTLTATGEAGWVDGAPLVALTARLDKLRASIRTDRQLTVSGNVQASLKGQQTELGGQLVIDQARILLPDEGTPTLGDDVVVRTTSGAAAGQKAPEKSSAAGAAAADKAPRPLKLGVQIDLGRDFRIQGKGIDTRVRGTLALSGSSLTDPRLTGTVNTDGGQYRAYGQRLDVEQGVIRFTGAIDNPTLDILAIRPNLTQRVGVQITGTALLPRVRLYAQPELPDAEKLSWLVVGRASASGGAEAALLQQAALALLGSKGGGMSGGLAASLGLDELSFRGSASNADGTTTAGAITLGKRFSSNFYAAYERSISGALGTLFIFYDLSQRFTVRGQAGEQSAVDLIYTFPYD